MKVALLVPSISFDDVIKTPVVRVFAESIATHVDTHIFALHYPHDVIIRQGHLKIYGLGSHKDRFSQRLGRTVRLIRREHERSPFDLLHALWLHEPGTIAITAGLLLRTPVVASVGGAEVVALPDIAYGALRTIRGRLMTAHVLQRSTLVTAGSRYALRHAHRIVPHRDPDRFRHAPLPVDVDRFAPAQPGRIFDSASPHIVHAASLIPVKDQATLLRAFRRVVDLIPGARLTIAGEDPFGIRDDIERLRDSLHLNEAVALAGRLSHEQMPGLYQSADLFMLSSRHESQAMVVLEAAAAGIPTVGTAVGVVPDLAPECAIAVRTGDPVALADALISLVTDPARLERMGYLARRRVVEEYSAPVVADRFLDLYNDAIGRQQR